MIESDTIEFKRAKELAVFGLTTLTEDPPISGSPP